MVESPSPTALLVCRIPFRGPELLASRHPCAMNLLGSQHPDSQERQRCYHLHNERHELKPNQVRGIVVEPERWETSDCEILQIVPRNLGTEADGNPVQER